MQNFEFITPSKIIFGAGKLAEAGTLVAPLGKKALIVCDEWTVDSGLARRLADILDTAGVASAIYSGVIPNPTSTLIDAGAEIASGEGCDFVIGLGGGSSMDAAKGIAVAVTHDGPIWDYAIGNKGITPDVLPIVAITTTSGTGSQCTIFAVITNPETHQKPGMGSPFIMPKLALIDPELMLTAPKQLTAETGFDVFSHAVEAYTSVIASELSDMYAEKALTLTGKHLKVCYDDGSNLEARAAMALADTCAGVAICNAVVTLAHVMAHVISGHFADIPHGDALQCIYREVLRFNSQALAEKHRFIANAIAPGNDDVASAFDTFFSQFSFRHLLKEKYQADPGIIDTIAEETFTYMAAITELNPVPATVADAKAILAASMK